MGMFNKILGGIFKKKKDSQPQETPTTTETPLESDAKPEVATTAEAPIVKELKLDYRKGRLSDQMKQYRWHKPMFLLLQTLHWILLAKRVAL